MMHPILAHGAVGFWDEVACLAIPATVILGVALAVLREKPQPEVDDASIDGPPGEVPAATEPEPHGEKR